ncbi:MAG: hypothetical protein J7M18_02805, partial [Candidatus Eremiobacteraeota bacterium]|nr:hypothetical protein [Candidatus Eremiobacteraeota bacterium]
EAPAYANKAQQALKKMNLPENATVEEFVIRAIETLREGNYKGIHTVYSGFNEAFRKYFPNLDLVKTIDQLVNDGKIARRPGKGGVVLYKADEAPSVWNKGDDALKKMGL